MNKKKKNDEFNIKEFISTPRGKSIVFFGAYLLFFIFIGVIARSGGSGNRLATNKQYDTGSPLQFSLANIEGNNYKFTYEVEIDGNYISYTGVKDNNREKVTCTNLTEFYGENGNYFTNNNGVWVKTNTPYLYSEFYNLDNISALIESSTYVSKTEYESGKDVFNFELSSASVSKILGNGDIDVAEVPNELMVSSDENNYVNEVKFTLNSYCKVKGICTNSMKVTLKYELYGEIEEITSPLE